MRGEKCEHIGDPSTNSPIEAMEHRIEIIKEFQKAIPPKKTELSEKFLRRWDEIYNLFDSLLIEAQEELTNYKENQE